MLSDQTERRKHFDFSAVSQTICVTSHGVVVGGGMRPKLATGRSFAFASTTLSIPFFPFYNEVSKYVLLIIEVKE